ncbi:MAG: hypothetical protein JSW58_08065 [Candidatus Latescibacterota bacterium]|nr:MAG: hypothetical protein JSW58_08065 [Candidatus Latescibacterota bacterium]
MGTGLNIGIFAIGLLLAVAAYLAYRRTTPVISSRLRVVLTVLRVLSFALLAFLLIDPRYVLRSDREEPARVVTLIDRSASMTLPAHGPPSLSHRARFEEASRIAGEIGEVVTSRGGSVSDVYFSGGIHTAETDSVLPDGQGTDIRGSLENAFKAHEGDNIAAFVVISDGVETEKSLVRRPVPPVAVFTIGVGDTEAPEDVRIRDVDYNSIVRAPSRSTIETTIEYSGDPNAPPGTIKQVKLLLTTESGETVFEKDTLFVGAQREISQSIPVDFREPGRRQFRLDVVVGGHDAEPENNRRDIVIEAEKAGVRVLIVDLLPTWELHFITDLLRRDQTFDFDLVSITAESPSLAKGKTVEVSEFLNKLGDYDVLVLVSLNPDFLSGRTAGSIKRFVLENGKGLLVLPAPSSLFERPRAWNSLADVLPVKGNPPFRHNLQYTSVRPGAQAINNPITVQLAPRLSRTDWQQRSPLLGYYTPLIPKQGVEILLETTDARSPALVYHEVGEGRVALVSAGPLWRWKFLADNNTVYDELLSRVLDFLARGDETERFVLKTKKNVYDSGEMAVLTAEVFNEKMQPVTGVPVRVEVSRVTGETEVPLDIFPMLRDGADNTRFKTTLPPLGPGRYRIRGEADLPGRTLASEMLDISVSEVSVEFQRVNQDRSNLMSIARQSGGVYFQGDDIAEMIDRIPLEARIVETTSEISLRTSVIVFVIVLVLLSLEWIIRKRVGMI